MRLQFTIVLLALATSVFGQQAPPATPAPKVSADPYASNADAGRLQFPLAAPAGKDSGAIRVAPQGAVNQGAFDASKWTFGMAFDPPAGAKLWNPVKLKMIQGGKVSGGTVFSGGNASTTTIPTGGSIKFDCTGGDLNVKYRPAACRAT